MSRQQRVANVFVPERLRPPRHVGEIHASPSCYPPVGPAGMSIKLEFIEDGYEGGPLLLFWGGGAEDVSGMIRVFESLSNRVGDRVSLHELPFIEAQPYVSVIAISGERSSGVRTRNGTLEWQQSTSDWDNAAGLLEAFADDAHGGGFQHLNMSDGAELIYSTRRSW